MSKDIIGNVNDLYNNFKYFLNISNPINYDFSDISLYKEYIDDLYESIDYYYRAIEVALRDFYNDKYTSTRTSYLKKLALSNLVKCNNDPSKIYSFYKCFVSGIDKDFYTVINEEKYDSVPYYVIRKFISLEEGFNLIIRNYKFNDNKTK